MSRQRRSMAKIATLDHGGLTNDGLSTAKGRLLHYHEIPSWQQENEYILTGYRPTSGSVRRSLEALSYLNNETVSTYSHIFGAILFAVLPYWIYQEILLRYPTAGFADIVVFSTFFYGVAVCLALSAACHIIWNHSPTYAALGNKLDYLGIVILMWGSTIPTEYYGFYCDPYLQRIYWSMTAVLYSGCCILTIDPKFSRPEFRPYRATMYAISGLSALVFIAHGLWLYGWVIQKGRMALNWMCLMAIFNLLGAAFYATRIPEAWYPYRFDIFGGSHQIFHIMVILAGLAHMVGLLQAFHYTHSLEGFCAYK